MSIPKPFTTKEACNLPDKDGHFGPYGGIFVAETLMHPLEEFNKDSSSRCQK